LTGLSGLTGLKDENITERIIGCAFKVHRVLGQGFLEKVYENALSIELRKCGFEVEQQRPVPVYYEGERVGEYFADLLIDGRVICEIKTTTSLGKEQEAQLVNYLVASGIDTGLLIGFGSSVVVRRKFREPKSPVNPENPVNPVK
jgi:GxxExxY protein